MSKPLVSVILPTYNRPDRLREAVDSVLNQTVDDIELIVIDDHSSPPAEEALAEVDCSGIFEMRLLRHDRNRGQNAARNTGIREATGEYVALLDDDDVWLEEKLERQVATFRRSDDDVGVVFTGQKHVNESGEVIGYSRSDASGDLTEYILAGGKTAPTSSIMARMETVEKGGLLDEECPMYTDRDWLLQLSTCCTFESITDPLVVRRMGSSDRVSDNFEMKRDVAIPYWIEKHRPLAAEYGWLCERKFMSQMALHVGRSGVKYQHFSDARKYLLKSIVRYPFRLEPYLYLIVAMGGSWGYELGLTYRRLSRKIAKRLGRF